MFDVLQKKYYKKGDHIWGSALGAEGESDEDGESSETQEL
jgi:hypothetical protein